METHHESYFPVEKVQIDEAEHQKKRTGKTPTGSCPKCDWTLNQLYLRHLKTFLPIGLFCKQCGYVKIYTLKDIEKRLKTNRPLALLQTMPYVKRQQQWEDLGSIMFDMYVRTYMLSIIWTPRRVSYSWHKHMFRFSTRNQGVCGQPMRKWKRTVEHVFSWPRRRCRSPSL